MGACVVTGMRAPVEASPECPVCLDRYRRTPHSLPRFLLCGHTFCTSCLDHLLTSTTRTYIRCPLCRADHPRNLPVCPVNPCLQGVMDVDEAAEVSEVSRARFPFSTGHRQVPGFRLRVSVNPVRYFVPFSMVCLEDAVVLLGDYEDDGLDRSGGMWR